MRYVHTVAFLLLSLALHAQKKTDPAELYPVFKSIKVKWDNKSDYVYEAPLNECITGNCSDGEGIRLAMDKLELNRSGYALIGTIMKGRFSNSGNNFNGKIYKFKLPADGVKNEKELRLNTPLDISDDAALKPYYYAEGGMGRKAEGLLKPEQYPWVWDGEMKNAALLAKTFPDAEIHKAMFNKGNISWIDVDLPATHRFIRYTGHTFASGDFMLGKALLDNGDVYEGFFLRHSFHGPGKLTKRSGKILQGIWQVDSLTQEVKVEFPAALLQAALPNPTQVNITVPNGWTINGPTTFYGEVVNNEAMGWGLGKIVHFTPKLVYGYWQHNQLEGPGIYLVSPDADQLNYESGNKTTFQNEFWIYTGVYRNGKIVNGTQLRTIYSVYGNKDNVAGEIPGLSFDKIYLSTDPLQGCGMQAELWYSTGYHSKPSLSAIKEGTYNNGQLTGFYFENDKEKKRSYELLRFAGYNPYQPFKEDIIKSAEASNDFCYDAMNRYKPFFVAEMKKKLEGNLAAEAWAKSPEGIAHKQRVEEANRLYDIKRKKDCDAEFAKIGVKGRTYLRGTTLLILEGYDCDKKEYIAWRPRQGTDIYSAPAITQIRGSAAFALDQLTPSVKQYHTCDACNGTGKILTATTTTRTKELPFGYFSGIETKSIRTTTKEELKTCGVCGGMAIVLQ